MRLRSVCRALPHGSERVAVAQWLVLWAQSGGGSRGESRPVPAAHRLAEGSEGGAVERGTHHLWFLLIAAAAAGDPPPPCRRQKYSSMHQNNTSMGLIRENTETLPSHRVFTPPPLISGSVPRLYQNIPNKPAGRMAARAVRRACPCNPRCPAPASRPRLSATTATYDARPQNTTQIANFFITILGSSLTDSHARPMFTTNNDVAAAS